MPLAEILLEALPNAAGQVGAVSINSPAHMVGPLVPLEQPIAGAAGRLSVSGTMRVQNLMMQLMEIDQVRKLSFDCPLTVLDCPLALSFGCPLAVL